MNICFVLQVGYAFYLRLVYPDNCSLGNIDKFLCACEESSFVDCVSIQTRP